MNSKITEYIHLIHEFNQHKNISGFKTLHDIEILGVKDSINTLSIAEKAGVNFDNANVADIGAGAGFPSLPFLLQRDNFKLTVIEGMATRCDFLNDVKNILNISNLVVLNKRSEDTISLSESFDIVTARAVSSVKNMFLLTHHLLKIGGILCLPKGKNYIAEVEELLNLFPNEKNNISIHEYKNDSNEISAIVLIKKTKSTPKKWPLSWKQISNYKSKAL